MDEIAYYRSFFEKARQELNNFFHQTSKNLPLEEHDLEVSKIIQTLCEKEGLLRTYKFFSEEQPNDQVEAPIIILDPIDGTREYQKGSSECCVSMSFIQDYKCKKKNFHWIWNFREGVSIQYPSHENKDYVVKENVGLISRRESEEGYFENFTGKFPLKPVGSIANKLLKLYLGECRFVFSQSPKNIWDILAGTMILESKEIFLWDARGRVLNLAQKRFHGPLLWADENTRAKLTNLLG